MIYTGDFETTTDPTDCRVWAWGLCEINNDYKFTYGEDIASLFAFLSDRSNTVYFHNLKFDGEFWLYFLFRSGYKFVKVIKNLAENTDREVNSLQPGQFTTLISDKGQWYSIKICISKRKGKSVFLTLYDSLKVLPFTVKKIAEAFKLPEQKGEIDYKKNRPVGYKMDENEISYLKRDCVIVAKALHTLFDRELTAMTTGSNALKYFKQVFNKQKFDRLFPVLDPVTDTDIRYSYRGGFAYLQPCFKNKMLGAGIVLDVNSLYPYVMYTALLPYDYPVFFTGEYVPDPLYPLYTIMLSCTFEIKPKHIPTIQIKLKDNPVLGGLEYLTSSRDMEVTLCLTSVDLALFLDHYDVYNIQYHSGWKYKATTGLFCDYIDIWTKEKIAAKKDGNGGMYTLSKLMLNSLYGKFSTSPECQSKEPEYDGNLVKLVLGEKEMRNGVYIPVGTFITSYARNHTIRAAQKVYDRFIYADTDSLHLIGTEIPAGLQIDSTALGAWKHEQTFSKAKFLRAKSYMELGRDPEHPEEPEKLKITVAGLPEICHDQVTFENFHINKTYHGKIAPAHYPGGIILEDINFTLSGKLTYFNH